MIAPGGRRFCSPTRSWNTAKTIDGPRTTAASSSWPRSRFAAMYALMYAMVDRFANVYASFNRVYIAGLMAAPMALIPSSSYS